MLVNKPLVEMRLTVVNKGMKCHKIMSAVPYLTGLSLGENRETNLGVRLREFGQSRAPAWSLNGDIYSRGWSVQWNAAYEPAMNEGIGMIIKEISFGSNEIIGIRLKVLDTQALGRAQIYALCVYMWDDMRRKM
jgi:hypothetical protein